MIKCSPVLSLSQQDRQDFYVSVRRCFFQSPRQSFIKSLVEEIRLHDGTQLVDVLPGRPRPHHSRLAGSGSPVAGRRCQAEEPPFYPVCFLRERWGGGRLSLQRGVKREFQPDKPAPCQEMTSQSEGRERIKYTTISTPPTIFSCCQLVSINPVISV